MLLMLRLNMLTIRCRTAPSSSASQAKLGGTSASHNLLTLEEMEDAHCCRAVGREAESLFQSFGSLVFAHAQALQYMIADNDAVSHTYTASGTSYHGPRQDHVPQLFAGMQ